MMAALGLPAVLPLASGLLPASQGRYCVKSSLELSATLLPPFAVEVGQVGEA